MIHSGRLWPYPQTLDEAGKAVRDKYSWLLHKFINYGRKRFIGLAQGVYTKTLAIILRLKVKVGRHNTHCNDAQHNYTGHNYTQLNYTYHNKA